MDVIKIVFDLSHGFLTVTAVMEISARICVSEKVILTTNKQISIRLPAPKLLF